MKDWLGNNLNVGDLVVYTSKSQYVGMVLGHITEANSVRIKIKPVAYSGDKPPAKIITLQSYQPAYKAVTRYFGEV